MEAKATDFAGCVLLILVTRPFAMTAGARPMLKTLPHREPVEQLGNKDCAEAHHNHVLDALGWVKLNYSDTQKKEQKFGNVSNNTQSATPLDGILHGIEFLPCVRIRKIRLWPR
jgi:hypothetical protein